MIMAGTPEEVQNNPEVIKAYLGDEDLYSTRG
jgi:branched-chain amino acid transport system ATP-binding protein